MSEVEKPDTAAALSPGTPQQTLPGQGAYDMLASMPMGCCVVDHDLKILFWNSCLEQWTQRSAKSVIGQNILELFPLLKQTRYRNRIDDVYRSGSPAVFSSAFTPQIFSASGHFENMVQQSTITRFNEGSVNRLLFNITDVSEQSKRIDAYKQLLKEKQAHQTQLKHINERLSASNKYLQDFAYIVSHDLKSPLRNVNNLVTWIVEDLEGTVSDEIQDFIDKLKQSVSGMTKLIESLLEYSRAGNEAGIIQLFPIEQSCKDVITLLDTPEHIDIEIDIHVKETCSSELLFQQIISNLLSNAIKYNDKDEGRIKVECHPLSHEKMICTVSDNGMGIEERFHNKVFQIFQKAHDSKKIDSNGIGLSLVKKIVEQADGVIALESQPGKGTSISFTWPLCVETEQTA